MLLVGTAIISMSVFVKENEEDIFGFGSVDLSVIYLAIACGVLIIIISFFGCVGVNQIYNHILAHIIYIIYK